MKKVSIILNVVLIIVTLFFVLYAQIQTKLAAEKNSLLEALATEAFQNRKLAEQEAANAREAEAYAIKAQMDLEECKKLYQ